MVQRPTSYFFVVCGIWGRNTHKNITNMKVPLIAKNRCRLLLFLLFTIGLTNSMRCGASELISTASLQNDSTIARVLGDSIYGIIKNAKEIEVSTIIMQNDTTRKKSCIKIGKQDRSLVDFIVLNPMDYKSNIPVWGLMLPTLNVKFSTKKAVIYFEYDFGLRKLRVTDYIGKQLLMFDLKSDNMIRFASLLFPNDPYFKEMLNPTNVVTFKL